MNNILYINPLGSEILFMIKGDHLDISKHLEKDLNTAESFPKILVELVDQYDIVEIWCIAGPGPFTLMRIITLSINALTYTRNILIKSSHFFDVIEHGNIPIIEVNSSEFLIRNTGEEVFIKKGYLPRGSYEGLFSENLSTEGVNYIKYKEKWPLIDHIFSTKTPEKRISPLYFKPPHITCPKP